MNRKRARRKVKRMIGYNFNFVMSGNAYNAKVVGYDREDLMPICEVNEYVPMCGWYRNLKEHNDYLMKGYKDKLGKKLLYIDIRELF